MTADSLTILVGLVGIGVVIALLLFVHESESIKSRDRATYVQKVRLYLLSFLTLTAILAVGLVFVTYSAIAFVLDLGLVVLVDGVIMMYLRPRGIFYTDVETSKWRLILAVGLAMIAVGLAVQVIFPSGPNEPTIGSVPGVLIGIGGLIAILSVISFRPQESEG